MFIFYKVCKAILILFVFILYIYFFRAAEDAARKWKCIAESVKQNSNEDHTSGQVLLVKYMMERVYSEIRLKFSAEQLLSKDSLSVLEALDVTKVCTLINHLLFCTFMHNIDTSECVVVCNGKSC